MSFETIYTKAQIIERIREIDAQIVELSSRPTSATVKGISSSYAGRLEALQKERGFWIDRLANYTSPGSEKNTMAGPTLEVY